MKLHTLCYSSLLTSTLIISSVLCHAQCYRDALWIRGGQGALGDLTGMAFSPDGSKLYTCGGGRIKVWNAFDHTIQAVIPTQENISVHSFSPDRKYIATADQTLTLWKLECGSKGRVLFTSPTGISAIDFSHDGKYVASVGASQPIRIFDIETGALVKSITVAGLGKVTAICFTHDGSRIVVADDKKTVKVIKIATETVEKEFSDFYDVVRIMEFSPDGRYLLIGSVPLELIDFQNNYASRTIDENNFGPSNQVIFSPSGKYIARDDIGDVDIWDIQADTLVSILRGSRHRISALAFSPDESTVLCGDVLSEIDYWSDWHVDISYDWNLWTDYSQSISDVKFSDDGRYLAGATAEYLNVYNVDSGTRAAQLFIRSISWVNTVAFSKGSKYLAAGAGTSIAYVWRVGQWDSLLIAHQFDSPVIAVRFLNDADSLMVLSLAGTVYLWDFAKDIASTVLVDTFAVAMDVSTASGQIATGGRDSLVRVWSLNGDYIRSLDLGKASVVSVNFNNDGRYLLSGAQDSTVVLWRTASGTAVTKIHCRDLVSGAAISHDNGYAIVGTWDSTITVYRLSDGDSVYSYSGYPSIVTCVAMSPTMNVVASGHDDAVVMWKSQLPKTDVPENPFEIQQDDVKYVCDGHTLRMYIQNIGNKSSETLSEFMLYNAIGQQVSHHNIGHVSSGQSELSIDVSELPSGSYYCTINGAVKSSGRFIVQR